MFWQFLSLFFTRYVSLAVLHDFYGYKRGIFTENAVFREKFKFIRLQTTLYQCIQFSRCYHCECFTFHRADFHNVNWESSPIYQLPVVTRIRANKSMGKATVIVLGQYLWSRYRLFTVTKIPHEVRSIVLSLSLGLR